ncbi:TSUP family transporter [Devriesea agamarum]|uniref:TSUP family transporter n=1 Tax=Devriesea agamarum TaxID=472569 RepID=UPI000B1CD6FE|nr:TSUP family transporter [Devriesea agamarum]
MKILLILLIVAANAFFAAMFIRNLWVHRRDLKTEPGNTVAQCLSSTIIYFLSTFGISDFAISTVLYRKLKWVDDRRLPGTLNAQCVIPVFAMAIAYITTVDVGMATLLTLIVAQTVGAYIGPRFVVKLPINTIRMLIATGLVIASLLIVASLLNIIPSQGVITELPAGKLVIAAILMFVYGALNNVGIGSYALTMATIYALGMNPVAAFPIMMGACAVSVPIGSSEFIRLNSYARKITLISAIFGVIGVLVAVFLVTSLPTVGIKWVVVAVLLYSAITMFMAWRAARNPSEGFVNEDDSTLEKVAPHAAH